jgi:hypothetical protein
MTRPWIPIALASLVLAGCAITQEVEPMAPTSAAEICIVEDPAVREGFLRELRATLESRGYPVRVLPPGSSTDSCPVTVTYLGRWSWDLALYMSYARIQVFQEGQLAGQALYDARRGSGNVDKFIDAEPKIRELASELFPER